MRRTAPFAPPPEQIAWAKTVLDEYDRATREGLGAITVNGRMIDAASLRMAQALVARERG